MILVVGGWAGLPLIPGCPDLPSIQALPSGPTFSQSLQGRLVSQGWVDGSQGKFPVGVGRETPGTGVEWEGIPGFPEGSPEWLPLCLCVCGASASPTPGPPGPGQLSGWSCLA